MSEPRFRTDMFQGTAQDYDRFRPPYPQTLIDDLARRCEADGTGTLLDLACGTGQLAFALHDKFAEVWAVDQESDMIAMVRAKARARGLAGLYAKVGSAEDPSVPGEPCDLVAIGNAFHRLPRSAAAANVLRCLRPGGFLALVWGGSPWLEEAPWQLALAELMQRWRRRAEAATGGGDRVPADYESDRESRPDQVILRESGFEVCGSWQFAATLDWTVREVAGYLFSTSVLSRQALGRLAPEFEQDLSRELGTYARNGRLRQQTSFRYDLARRPPAT